MREGGGRGQRSVDRMEEEDCLGVMSLATLLVGKCGCRLLIKTPGGCPRGGQGPGPYETDGGEEGRIRLGDRVATRLRRNKECGKRALLPNTKRDMSGRHLLLPGLPAQSVLNKKKSLPRFYLFIAILASQRNRTVKKITLSVACRCRINVLRRIF